MISLTSLKLDSDSTTSISSFLSLVRRPLSLSERVWFRGNKKIVKQDGTLKWPGARARGESSLIAQVGSSEQRVRGEHSQSGFCALRGIEPTEGAGQGPQQPAASVPRVFAVQLLF
ncbi:hypothetical protein Nepgr_004173 [Nepenthes gracilis]|uniref:Uncharacterized protein n=1 Tax=Nepenthes gracilis TaxID=150966 RepID=A0AAD3S105_NEPGR|nr:hypothetical protein Nepgr_004173 [Nepenthes gracilis]